MSCGSHNFFSRKKTIVGMFSIEAVERTFMERKRLKGRVRQIKLQSLEDVP